MGLLVTSNIECLQEKYENEAQLAIDKTYYILNKVKRLFEKALHKNFANCLGYPVQIKIICSLRDRFAQLYSLY